MIICGEIENLNDSLRAWLTIAKNVLFCWMWWYITNISNIPFNLMVGSIGMFFLSVSYVVRIFINSPQTPSGSVKGNWVFRTEYRLVTSTDDLVSRTTMGWKYWWENSTGDFQQFKFMWLWCFRSARTSWNISVRTYVRTDARTKDLDHWINSTMVCHLHRSM